MLINFAMFVVNATKTENGGTRLTVVPHVCGICKRAFLQERTLLQHFQTHEENQATDKAPESHIQILNAEILARNINSESHIQVNDVDSGINVQAHEEVPPVDYISVDHAETDEENTSVDDPVTQYSVSVPADSSNNTYARAIIPIAKEYTNLSKKQHKCNICDRNFSSKAYLQKHFKLHKGDRSYICDVCNKSFVLKDNLMKHFTTHDPDKKRYFCLECGKGFTSRQYKEKHELIHLGEKPHVCGICNKAFTLKTNLNKHIVIHSEERYKYLCNICDKGFSSKSYLDKHHLIHAGEKPHVCGICHRAFTLKTNLHKHYLTHTGYRRFGCEICFKRFKTKASLEQHHTIHSDERPFNCAHCNQGFKQKAHLEKHMRVHGEFISDGDNVCSNVISINEDCVEIIIDGQNISEDYDNNFDDQQSFYDAGIVDSKNNRAFNVNTDACDNSNVVTERFIVKHQTQENIKAVANISNLAIKSSEMEENE